MSTFMCPICKEHRSPIYSQMIPPLVNHHYFGEDYSKVACIRCNIEAYTRQLILCDHLTVARTKHNLFNKITKWATDSNATLQERQDVLHSMRHEADGINSFLLARYPAIGTRSDGTWYPRETPLPAKRISGRRRAASRATITQPDTITENGVKAEKALHEGDRAPGEDEKVTAAAPGPVQQQRRPRWVEAMKQQMAMQLQKPEEQSRIASAKAAAAALRQRPRETTPRDERL